MSVVNILNNVLYADWRKIYNVTYQMGFMIKSLGPNPWMDLGGLATAKIHHSIFSSKYEPVANTIKETEVYMVVNMLHLHTPKTPGVGSTGQTIFSKSNHVACQLEGI